MQVLCLLHAAVYRPPPAQRLLSHVNVRFISCSGPAWKNHGRPRESQVRRTSLFDEIFAEEEEQSIKIFASLYDNIREIPRLPLSSLDHFASFSHRSRNDPHPTIQRCDALGQKAFHEESSAILVFGRASRSLLDEDFRKIAPEAGNILKGADQHTTDTIYPCSG